MKESVFQRSVIETIKKLLPGCYILKNDPDYIQGFPDLLVLYQGKWAALECKQSAKAKKQPNQDYYVRALDDISFARFIYPENKETVLHELQQALQS